MAGGLRPGSGQAEVDRAPRGRRRRRIATSTNGPAVAIWEGRILAVGGRAPISSGSSRRRAIRSARFARLDARGGTVTPGPRRPPHPPAVRRQPRGRAGAAPAGRRLPRDPRCRRRDPLDRRGDAGGVGGRARRPRPALARRDARPRRHDDRGQVRLRAGPRRPSCGCSRSPTGSAREGPDRGRSDLARRPRGAAGVPRPAGRRSRRTSGYLIEEQLPGVAAQGRARFADVFCEEGVFSADQSRRILEAAAGFGLRPRLHADELAPSGGAELAAEIGATSRRPPRGAVRGRDRRPRGGGRRGPAGRRDAAARRRRGS